jgi:hypothetical protein
MSLIRGNIGPEGALIEAVVAVHTARERLLKKNNLPVPPSNVIKAQIDTGAYCCGVDKRIFEALQLWGEIDQEEILTSSTEEVPYTADVYVANLTLLSSEGNRAFDTLRILAHSFGASEEARAVIGRDVLASCHFIYDGKGGTFTLDF